MSKKHYLLLAGVALLLWLAYPKFKTYRAYQKAMKDPLNASVGYLASIHDSERWDTRLKARYDEVNIQQLLENCTPTEEQFRFGGSTDCCEGLRWHLRQHEQMYDKDRYRAALDSCVFFNALNLPPAERVHLYRELSSVLVKEKQFKEEINLLAKEVSPLELMERRRAANNAVKELEDYLASGHRDLITYLENNHLPQDVPVYIQSKMSLPKPYSAYSAAARTLVESLMKEDQTFYLKGKQPEQSDFDRVQLSTWNFTLQKGSDYQAVSMLEEHLNKYYNKGWLNLSTTKGAPLGLPRIEITFQTRNMEDTIQGITVPVLSVRSTSKANEKYGYESSFDGYSMTTQLEVTLLFRPENPNAEPYVYRGTAGPDAEVYSMSGNPMDLTEKTNKTALENAVNNLLRQIYDQVPIAY